MEQAVKTAKARLSSVANAIRLLTSFSGEEDELGITTLAGRLRLAKSTVHRLAATLTGAGFLEQNGETGKYRLGVALFELGALVRRRMDVANEARPKLRELLEKTGETVQLGIVDHFSVLYVYEMESRRAIRMAAAVGGRAPLHCTAVGKVLLAHQPGDYVKEAIGRGLTAYTPKTITKREAVLAMLDEVRLRSHANDGEKKRRHTLADHLYGSDHDHVHGDGSADHDHDHDHDLGPAGPPEENPLWLHDNLSLVSVGIDIGSAGTQVIFSRLHMRRL